MYLEYMKNMGLDVVLELKHCFSSETVLTDQKFTEKWDSISIT